jgi:hypothetical protein
MNQFATLCVPNKSVVESHSKPVRAGNFDRGDLADSMFHAFLRRCKGSIGKGRSTRRITPCR